jgi:hypothetical protein
MWGYRFICEMAKRCQNRDWIKFDDVCPYSISHTKQRKVLPFVADYHFDRYCGRYTISTWVNYKQSKRRKLYWRLHPQYKRW